METFNQAINFGVFILPWSAIMLTLGLVVGAIVTHFLAKKRGFHKDFALDCCIVAIPCGVIGSRLFAALSGKIDFADFFRLNVLGVNLFGALIFAALGLLVYAKLKKLCLAETFDVLTPGLFFGMAVGRWADFFLCDGLGPIVPAGVPKFFPLVTFTAEYFQDGKTVAYSIFFLEFLICAVIGAAALLLLASRKLKKGDVFLTLIGGYAFLEFFLEWMRPEEMRQLVFSNIRFNQMMSLLILVTIVLYYLIAAYRRPVALTEDDADASDDPVEEERSEEAVIKEDPAERESEPDDLFTVDSVEQTEQAETTEEHETEQPVFDEAEEQ